MCEAFRVFVLVLAHEMKHIALTIVGFMCGARDDQFHTDETFR